MKGHIKATCYKYLALQGNENYQKNKAKHSNSVQLCSEILEDAAGMGKYKHCFQYDCTPSTCFFPPKQHESMVEATALFFDTGMHGVCLQTKSDSWDTPHTYGWYANNNAHNNHPREEAYGYWHDYAGHDREAWVIEAERHGGYYTDEWFEKEKKASKKRKKESALSSTKKIDKDDEASGG